MTFGSGAIVAAVPDNFLSSFKPESIVAEIPDKSWFKLSLLFETFPEKYKKKVVTHVSQK